jgi:hypothetical protein
MTTVTDAGLEDVARGLYLLAVFEAIGASYELGCLKEHCATEAVQGEYVAIVWNGINGETGEIVRDQVQIADAALHKVLYALDYCPLHVSGEMGDVTWRITEPSEFGFPSNKG